MPPSMALMDVHHKTMDLAFRAQIYALLDTIRRYWHIHPFFNDCHQLVDDAVKYFEDTTEPFAFQLLGVKMYCLSRPEDVTGVLDGVPWTHGLNFSHFISEVMQKFGVALKDVERAKYNPKPGDDCYIEGNPTNPTHLNLIHFIESLYKRQFLQPPSLNALADIFVQNLQETLQSENLGFCTRDYNGSLYNDGAPSLQRDVSLHSLVTGSMVNATIRALFGPYLHELEPDIVNQVVQFNSHAWVLFYGLPDFFGFAPVCASRDRVKAALRAFIKLPEEQRSEQCFAFKELLRWMDVLDIGEESRVGLLLLFFFASIANEQNACYWFVAHIIYDEELLGSVKREIEPAWESGKLDVKYLAANCPNIDAIFHETLRQRANTFGFRAVKEKTTIRGKELQPGTPVMVPLRLLHSYEKVWGSTVDEFDPSRFLKKKTLSRQPYYRPFAGGPTFCPGRNLAKHETYAFLATLLHRFDVTLPPPSGESPNKKQPFPLMETFKPPTGVKGPLPGMDLFVKLVEKAPAKPL
ncbi:hypothetical protein EKO27_g9358 [Xylaria grammica]|uniref:Cytochrome P450 n=1 Tax=Xylaria grammica TaxID=363999 RepID=A0A439CU84_9PEZI|nr:hypothetical protein EKO27_g9358 [Xylaria grammica]